MLKSIVNFLNLKLELLNYFDLTRCLVELKTKGDVVAPKEYIASGEWQNVDFDAFDGVSYWRLRDPITVSREANPNKALKRVQTTVPMKLVFSVRRTKLTEDDAYSFDRIRQTIVKQFNIDNGALTTALGAAKVTITAPSSDGDPLSVWDAETNGTGTQEPNFKYVFGSIDIDIVIDSDTDCLPTECDEVDSDILHTFDFCEAAVRDRLTDIQVTCLTDAYCSAGLPVTEQINGVTIGTVAAGGTNNQVITDSKGSPVGTEANPSVIGDSTVTVNGDSLGSIGSVFAEGSVDLVVNLDGSPSGSWDGNSWEVTSAACADATVNVNGVFIENIPSGDTENIEVRQETGATLVGSKQGQYWRVDDATVENSDASYSATVAAEGSLVLPNINFTDSDGTVSSVPSVQDITCTPSTGGGTLTIGVYSDAGLTTPVTSGDYGAIVYIKLTATGIVPTSYTFSIDGSNDKVVSQAGDTYVWTIDSDGAVSITARATDGSGATANATAFSFTSNVVINQSISFDGVNDLTTSWSLPLTGENFSVSMWIKMNNTSANTPFFSFEDSFGSRQSFGVGYYQPAGEVIALAWNQEWNNNTGGAIVADNNWHNLIATYNATTDNLIIYWDGISIVNVLNFGIIFNQNTFRLARFRDWPGVGGRYGDVNVTDIGIHDTVLSTTQVAAMQTLGVASGDEVQRYPIVESVGTTTGYIEDIIGGLPMQLTNMIAPYGVVADTP